MRKEAVPSFNAVNKFLDLAFIKCGRHWIFVFTRTVHDCDIAKELDNLAETVRPNDNELVESRRRNVGA